MNDVSNDAGSRRQLIEQLARSRERLAIDGRCDAAIAAARRCGIRRLGRLVRSDPRDVPRIIALSRASYRKMIQNLWWGVCRGP